MTPDELIERAAQLEDALWYPWNPDAIEELKEELESVRSEYRQMTGKELNNI